jgi:GT2 family glycosyltransferase
VSGRRLDLGIASYGNPDGLRRALDSIQATAATDWRCLVVVNPHPDETARAGVGRVLARDDSGRVVADYQERNIGYPGAVNAILNWAESEYVAYLDHDVVLNTPGWDEAFAGVLDRFHELGMLFANGGPYPIERGPYQEILWGVGCCWMIPRRLVLEVGLFDEKLGHHEEVDYQTRVRLAGYRIAALPSVSVSHMAQASGDPESAARIAAGVRAWVDKWCAYFGGRGLGYTSPNVMRHDDWPPLALYLEEYWLRRFPDLNKNPEVIVDNGVEFDLIKTPRLKGFYRHRVPP